jgi:hypothetical protein
MERAQRLLRTMQQFERQQGGSNAIRGPQPRLISAHYDREADRICMKLSNGLDLGVPIYLVEGLTGAQSEELAELSITASGLGLHWARLHADLDLPTLLTQIMRSRRWMARAMGKAGGAATTSAKRSAARLNGRLGGRPRGVAVAVALPERAARGRR